ncbi:unnamed protein product [Clonostachys solani]|uniref:Uncharacterized protein n=1 Tax=Clonostachys solani TaxID=160281 RepID=A0A9P0ENF3_9HYPO|nr:unnamed protein product [Clonostachys solani]
MAFLNIDVNNANSSTAWWAYLATTIVLGISILFFRDERPYPGIPILGMEKGWFGMNSYYKTKKLQTLKLSRDTAQFKGKCYQVLSTTGFKIILPPSFLDEVKSKNELSFVDFIEHDFFAKFPGFGAFGAGSHDNIIQDTIKVKLSGSLAKVTDPLSEEMGIFLNSRLPVSTTQDWTEQSFRDISVASVAQLSSRVFLGENLCRDPRWLGLAIKYTTDVVAATRAMRMWPRFSHPIIHWFLPQTRKARQDLKETHELVAPILERRRQDQLECSRNGLEYEKPVDALQWLEDMTKGRALDIVNGQLLLSFASIHTTSGLLQGVMYDLCANPEYIDLLRAEVIEQLSDHSDGWKKTSLHALKMMDSVLKESQRLNTVSLALIHRRVRDTITLSDNTVLPKGSAVATPTAQRMLDPLIWPDSNKFVGRRFYDLRMQTGNENKAQFVSTTVDHFGFGVGSHACPGRFFASNESKIILVHLLMKYDWKFIDGRGRPERIFLGHESFWDPKAKVLVKSRQSEIQFPGE